MQINSVTPNAERYEIYDCRGNKIPYVTFFDTETNEIELALRVIPVVAEGEEVPSEVFLSEINNENNPSECLLRFLLKGAYAKLDGEIVK